MKKLKITIAIVAIVTLAVSSTAYFLNANVSDGYVFETVNCGKGICIAIRSPPPEHWKPPIRSLWEPRYRGYRKDLCGF